MLPGQMIVGDDIAYLRKWDDGYCHIANIEEGIFGIIRDVNQNDDPAIYNTINSPGEVIFSNVLVHSQKPYWLGMGVDLPDEGINFSGKWHLGKTDKNGMEIPLAHPNARYTVRIKDLQNADPELHNPDGVKLNGIFYGGRDSDTMPPIVESLDWVHGVFIGASIESETTAQTLGKIGIRKLNPMANLDFIVVPLGKYINDHLKFGSHLKITPKVFSTNYFLKDEDLNYLNGVLDKLIWVIWAEGRIHGEYEAIETPIGYIPRFKTLKELFRKYLKKDYKLQDYETQFCLRISKILDKLDRVEQIYSKESDIPEKFWQVLNTQRSELKNLYSIYRKNMILPTELLNKY
jgi:phosphoenolpyruvate carboxykinase (GTP)